MKKKIVAISVVLVAMAMVLVAIAFLSSVEPENIVVDWGDENRPYSGNFYITKSHHFYSI